MDHPDTEGVSGVAVIALASIFYSATSISWFSVIMKLTLFERVYNDYGSACELLAVAVGLQLM